MFYGLLRACQALRGSFRGFRHCDDKLSFQNKRMPWQTSYLQISINRAFANPEACGVKPSLSTVTMQNLSLLASEANSGLLRTRRAYKSSVLLQQPNFLKPQGFTCELKLAKSAFHNPVSVKQNPQSSASIGWGNAKGVPVLKSSEGD
jgi:hypothetical protein